jgi:hypothetical protein
LPKYEKTTTIVVPCGYAMEGLGFYFIPVTENPKVSAQETRVVVRVLEGSIIVNQLTVELEKIISGTLGQLGLVHLL